MVYLPTKDKINGVLTGKRQVWPTYRWKTSQMAYLPAKDKYGLLTGERQVYLPTEESWTGLLTHRRKLNRNTEYLMHEKQLPKAMTDSTTVENSRTTPGRKILKNTVQSPRHSHTILSLFSTSSRTASQFLGNKDIIPRSSLKPAKEQKFTTGFRGE